MQKGDIVWAKDTKTHFHPIVFLETIDDYSFLACILSSKSTDENILMHQSHFKIHDDNGKEYRFRMLNSYLVKGVTFVKLNKWVKNENIVGRLSDEGILFVEKNIPKNPIYLEAPIWELNNP